MYQARVEINNIITFFVFALPVLTFFIVYLPWGVNLEETLRNGFNVRTLFLVALTDAFGQHLFKYCELLS